MLNSEHIVVNKTGTCLQVRDKQGKAFDINVSKPCVFVMLH